MALAIAVAKIEPGGWKPKTNKKPRENAGAFWLRISHNRLIA
jgi:hypothetical protein